MKKFFDGFKAGIGFFVAFVLLFIISFFAVKARSGLTATPGDKLTASNWNALVSNLSGVQTWINNAKRTTVSSSDTTNFDTTCEWRVLYGGNSYYMTHVTSTYVVWAWQDGQPTWNRLGVKSTEKANVYANNNGTTRATVGFWSSVTLQKKCSN